jgi:phage-related protein
LTIALLGIIIASILLVIEDLQAMGEGAESVSGTIAQGFLDSIDALGSWGEAVKDIFATTFEFWLGVSRETFQQIAAVIEEAVGTLLAPVEATIGMIINLFGSLITFFSDVFTVGVTTAFSNLWDNLRGMAQDLVDDVMSFFKPLFTFIGKGISVVADIVGIDTGAATVTRTATAGTNVAGVSPLAAVAPAAGAAPGASVVNNPQTDIKIDVDARGREGSGEVGQDIARAVDEVIQRRDRQTLQAYLQAAGSS